MNANDAKLVRDYGFELTPYEFAVPEDEYPSSRQLVCDDGHSIYAYYVAGEDSGSDYGFSTYLDSIEISNPDGSNARYAVNGDSAKLDYVLSTLPDDLRVVDASDFWDLYDAMDTKALETCKENDAKVLTICEQTTQGFDPQAYVDIANIRANGGISLSTYKSMLEHDLVLSNVDVDMYSDAYKDEHGYRPSVSEFYIDADDSKDRVRQCKELCKEGTEQLNRIRDMLLDTSRITSVPRIAELPGMEGRVVSALNTTFSMNGEADEVNRSVVVLYKTGESEQGDDFGGWLVSSSGRFISGNQPNSFDELDMGSAQFGVKVATLSVDDVRRFEELADTAARDGVSQDGGRVVYGNVYDDRLSDKFTSVSWNDVVNLREDVKPTLPIGFPKAEDAPLAAMREQFENGREFAAELAERDKALHDPMVDPRSEAKAKAYEKYGSYADEYDV